MKVPGMGYQVGRENWTVLKGSLMIKEMDGGIGCLNRAQGCVVERHSDIFREEQGECQGMKQKNPENHATYQGRLSSNPPHRNREAAHVHPEKPNVNTLPLSTFVCTYVAPH